MARKKLTSIPKPRATRQSGGSSTSATAASSDVAAPPDLSHIAEGLRPLAVPIGSIEFDPANARKHDDKNVTAIKASLRAYGQRDPIVVNKRTGLIEAGNGRLQAALLLGWRHVAVLYVDDDPTVAAGFSIADNRTAELAEWDTDALDKLLREVRTDDQELADMFEALAQAEKLIPPEQTEEGPEPRLDRAEELRKKWGVEPGQLWEIPSKSVEGKFHRLLCGDSTDAACVERLMGGERAGLMNTDPPCGMRDADIENDQLTDGADLQAFLESAIRAAVPRLIDNAAFYLWHPILTQGMFFAAAAAAAAADILIHRQIVWVKPGFVLTRSGMYHWKHELCFYGWRRGYVPTWLGDKSQVSVWEIGREGDSLHPTQKPVDLFARPMRNHLKEGEIAYEPFAGSGSQFVAGEQTGRLVHGLEIEPKYVAVCLQRMRDNGLSPRLVS